MERCPHPSLPFHPSVQPGLETDNALIKLLARKSYWVLLGIAMEPPEITQYQIQERCTEQSYMRGLDYFHSGAISNPTFHDYTLSGTCEGTDIEPYRVTVELTPTGIADADCSCLYDWGGDCKHIVALLLTYVHEPDAILSLEPLLTALAEKPKSNLLQVISELLKRAPELAPIAQAYSEVPVVPARTEPLPFIAVYREQIDRLFGDGFLEQHQLHRMLSELEALRQHASFLAQSGEIERALSILHALIHQSIVRYPDTLQQSDLPRFVDKCTKAFIQIVTHARAPVALFEHWQMLLELSFDAEGVFTPLLADFLEQLCLGEEIPWEGDTSELEAEIEEHLDDSPDRRAHVRLLLALYLASGRSEDYFRLAQSEDEGYRLIQTLFTLQQEDTAWKALQTFPLSVDEYWDLLQNPTCQRVSQFAEKLLKLLKSHQTETAVTFYQRLIDHTVLSRQHRDYREVRRHLTQLKKLYRHLDREHQWAPYLTDFQKRHARKRRLLEIIAEYTG